MTRTTTLPSLSHRTSPDQNGKFCVQGFYGNLRHGFSPNEITSRAPDFAAVAPNRESNQSLY